MRSNLWIINFDGSENRPLTTGNRNDSAPRWSPDGKRLLYVSSVDGTSHMQSDWSKEQPNPLRHELVKEPIERFKDGHLEPPPADKPGLGIELNEEILARYAVSS